DDMRDSPALSILPTLIEKGATINAHDPKGMEEAKELLPDSVNYFDDIMTTIENADAVVLMTEWNTYRGMDLKKLREKMKGNAFIDLRNVYESDQMQKAGFDYHCVGRK
ncbi:MAG: UDP binding domain-containing protein, partial [Gammaproteobacteria bacterium]